MRSVVIVVGIGAALAAASAARGQPLARRVSAAGDGTVQMRFASRDGVCGNGRGTIGTGGHAFFRDVSSSSDYGHWRPACVPGPVRVVAVVRGGGVDRLRVFVGGNDSSADVRDLGVVSAREAADYLLDVARRGAGRVGEQAILGAVLADSVTPWPALLPVAGNASAPRATRESAAFWLSRAAAAVVNHRALFEEDDDAPDSPRDEVRAQAIFALSQQPRDEGVPALIRVARTNRDPALRSRALFWLGQSGDPRAIELFAGIIGGANP